MGQDSCDGCGRPVSVTGGIANLWTFGEGGEGTAMVLEFDDEEGRPADRSGDLQDDEPSADEEAKPTLGGRGGDARYLLCFPCIEALPENPVEADVDALEVVDEETSRLKR